MDKIVFVVYSTYERCSSSCPDAVFFNRADAEDYIKDNDELDEDGAGWLAIQAFDGTTGKLHG